MKDLILDANFPRTPAGRVYHIGLKPGEIANRIVTVGDPKRARTIASHFDRSPAPFELLSERGFLTITGRYNGVPVSAVAIGMGGPNMDFFVREAREYGSCGALTDVPVGSLVVPDACVAVTRNWDFDFSAPQGDASNDEDAYVISKPVDGDRELHDKLVQVIGRAAETARTSGALQTAVLGDIVNAAADSFYSSQGRQTAFPDHNAGLIDRLLAKVPRLTTLEMETFHLYHLASVYPRVQPLEPSKRRGGIRASGVQMVFASRVTQQFITPGHVLELEQWVGRACLDALTQFEIAEELLHPPEDSVWA
ncbi:purine and uridine phosphorylase [Ceratobasidium sp. AG-I]|nr:purine and uridine phosphorylase [Ceratobasidium sp. AG-I]